MENSCSLSNKTSEWNYDCQRGKHTWQAVWTLRGPDGTLWSTWFLQMCENINNHWNRSLQFMFSKVLEFHAHFWTIGDWFKKKKVKRHTELISHVFFSLYLHTDIACMWYTSPLIIHQGIFREQEHRYMTLDNLL